MYRSVALSMPVHETVHRWQHEQDEYGGGDHPADQVVSLQPAGKYKGPA